MTYYKHNYLVKLFKILANSNRLKILEILDRNKEQPLTVNELADQLPISQKTLSNHLAKMRDNGIVKAKQSGLNMYYSIKDDNALQFARMAK
jgi:DNA-binding transcriptional ArsR family regulator